MRKAHWKTYRADNVYKGGLVLHEDAHLNSVQHHLLEARSRWEGGNRTLLDCFP
jgi:hypothetical protein